MFKRLMFSWRYFRRSTPWDTNITPPEVVECIESEKFPPGRALDLGCGTGTNAIYLAQHGFDTVGIDFVARAIDTARAKARDAQVQVEFRCADILNPGPFTQQFEFILDVGCFHSLDAPARARYVENLSAWTHAGSVVMLYTIFAFVDGNRQAGVGHADTTALFERDFRLARYQDDTKSAWYRWERK